MTDINLRLHKNISALKTVNNKPVPASRNDPARFHPDKRKIVLEFNEELDATECLTYLSAYTNDPERVMALCAEEKRGGRGLIVSMALNSGSTAYLQYTLERICEVLEAEAKCHQDQHLFTLLNIIAERGRSRILRLLNPNKNPTIARFQDALLQYETEHLDAPQKYQQLYSRYQILHYLCQRLAKTNTSSDFNTLLSSILLAATSTWENHQHEIIHILSHIPRFDISTKEVLISLLSKLGRYVPASIRLLDLAHRFPDLFQAIEVRSVSISPRSQPHKLHIHNLDPSISNPGPRQARYKVHAEIQLLFDYEMRRQEASPGPRVIVSSKSACFLCDRFIKLHGQFFMPGTHGRVYDSWSLPDVDRLGIPGSRKKMIKGVVGRLDGEVEGLVRKWRKREKKRRCVVEPRESDVFALAEISRYCD